MSNVKETTLFPFTLKVRSNLPAPGTLKRKTWPLLCSSLLSTPLSLNQSSPSFI